MISWRNGPPPNHAGFAGGDFKPGVWYEDRDKYGKRYGRRTGPYADPNEYNWYEGNIYYGEDQPNFHYRGELFSFRLIVVDVCNGDKTIYTSRTIHVQA
jgi:hypothetical protein